MADAPARFSPLIVRSRGPLEMVQVAAYGRSGATAELLSKHFGLAITPMPNRAVMAGDLTALWHGPGQWLMVRATPAVQSLANELARVCGDSAAVIDLGHARTVLRFEGENIGDVLAKGTSIDLRPASFPPGTCALTALGKINALLHAVAPATIDVYVPRSYAQALVEWLEHAARDVDVEFVRSEP
jgi:sarcosine oxidase subunit gamma